MRLSSTSVADIMVFETDERPEFPVKEAKIETGKETKEQESQYTYDVTLRRVRATIVAVEKQ
jgi:hypothetical protein